MTRSASVTSTNMFKMNTDFAGVVMDADSNPTAGVTVKIYDSSNKLLSITTMDQNGVYSTPAWNTPCPKPSSTSTTSFRRQSTWSNRF